MTVSQSSKSVDITKAIPNLFLRISSILLLLYSIFVVDPSFNPTIDSYFIVGLYLFLFTAIADKVGA